MKSYFAIISLIVFASPSTPSYAIESCLFLKVRQFFSVSQKVKRPDLLHSVNGDGYETLNESSRISVADYDQTIARNLKTITHTYDEYTHHTDFGRLYEALKPEDFTLDVGGGADLVSMDLVTLKKVKAVSISVHDFSDKIRDSLQYLTPENVKYQRGSVSAVGPYNRKDLDYFGDSVGLRFKGLQKPADAAFRAKVILDWYLKNKQGLQKSKRLTSLIGYAEKILPTLKRKFRMITDHYGAAFYSEKRAELIQNYYNSLATKNSNSPAGQAFILIGLHDIFLGPKITEESGSRAWDYVYPKDSGEPIEFYEYLVQKYPQIFSLHVSTTGMEHDSYLVITKSDQMPSLNLNLKPDYSQVSMYKGKGAYQFPTGVIYHEQ